MIFLYSFLLFIFLGCESNSGNPNQLVLIGLTYPVVTSVEPRAVNSSFSINGVNYSGSTVLIQGRNFSANISDNTVAFNGIPATINAATTTELNVTVPQGVASGVLTVSKLGGVCDSLDKKSGVNCGGADFFVSCYGAFKEDYGSQILLEVNKSNKITFSKSPTETKAFRVDLSTGLKSFIFNCPTAMDITTFSKTCVPTFTASVQPSGNPQITMEGGYTAEVIISTQPGECTFNIY